MKKKEIKGLKLNKNQVSTLQSDNVKGAGGSFDTLVHCSARTYCVSKCICNYSLPLSCANC
ncbi:hypothetical protein [Kordia sp.]|uniref:hypothetical protein n=1 Tax=Kordia sp. TaxID=1965332 RepID=UPI003D6BE37B